MYKRIFDILFSIIGLLVLSPVFILIALIIKLDSRGPILFIQERVGLYGTLFKLLKFRTMAIGSETKGLLTIGAKDSRVTKIGFLLRKYKLDELPQLINVLKGDMSFVGPRPEVQRYVNLYTASQRNVLKMRPGITDYASIYFRNESQLLALNSDPEWYYTHRVMQQKIRLNKIYLRNSSFCLDISIIIKTIIYIFK